MDQQKIVVLGTGGTIAGTAADAGDNVGYTAAQLGVAQLAKAVPALARRHLLCEQVAQVDSKDMDFEVWRRLALRCAHWLAQEDVQGIVITHGTDTLEETAYFLHSVLDARKPVVLTCAMRPATALMSDGPQNLLDAVEVAASPGVRGVVAVCAGGVHGALDVRKTQPYRVDAFSSGDAGPLAYVEELRLRCLRPWPESGSAGEDDAFNALQSASAWPWVALLTSHADATDRHVDALLQAGVQGLVVAATGNGTVHHALEQALVRALKQGVPVLRASRCEAGQMVTGAPGALPHVQGLSPLKARIYLGLRILTGRATKNGVDHKPA